MPFINLKTNVKVEKTADMQKELGKIIALIPGKSEARTMILIEGEKPLCFAGSDEPCAMVETQVNYGTDQSTAEAYCDAVKDMIVKYLGISEKRIYVNLTEIDNWYAW